MKTEVELFLYTEGTYFFSKPILDCPPSQSFTPQYRLLDEATGLPLSPEIFSIELYGDETFGQIRGRAPDKEWLNRSPLRLQIEVTGGEGQIDVSPALEITFIDLCIKTEIVPRMLMSMTTNRN